MQSHRQSQLCANMMYHESDLGQAGYPNLKCLHGKIWPRLGHISVWQTGLSALAGHSTYHEPWVPVNIFFLSILMVRLFHIRYFENGPLEPGYPSCKRDQIKMRDYMGMWVIPPTWGPPPPCKQALNLLLFLPFSLPPPSSLLKLPIVVIQKFRYHGNLRSHFSSLWWRDCVCGGRAS